MAKDNDGGYSHDASDRKLDETASAAARAEEGARGDGNQGAFGGNHDPAHIREHSDKGKDRLFEDRQQHDEAEKNSEKTRLARDVQRHEHGVDDDVADNGTAPSAKRKN
jgi:hypothetical protein